MSSHWDGLDDSWGERKARERAATGRRTRQYGLAVLGLLVVSIGAGAGASIHELLQENQSSDALSRLLGGIIGGFIASWFLLWYLISVMARRAAVRDVVGQRGEETDRSWLIYTFCLLGSTAGRAFGASLGLFRETKMSNDAFSAGLVGGSITTVLVVAIHLVLRGRRGTNAFSGDSDPSGSER